MYEQIERDLKQSMLQRDQLTTEVLRGLKASVKNESISKRVDQLSDEEFIGVLQREFKKRQEAINLYEQAGQSERAQKEKSEAEVISRYLPQQLEESQVKALINETIEEVGATDIKQMGMVMQALQPKMQGRADGSKVAQLVRDQLS